jgi:hypothetical protein
MENVNVLVPYEESRIELVPYDVSTLLEDSLVNLPSSVSSDYPEEDILGQLDNFQKIELLSVNHELNVLTSLVEDYQLNNQLELCTIYSKQCLGLCFRKWPAIN